jgi:alpha-galactosidase
VLHGDLYRLNDPLKGNLFAEMIVSKDKGKGYLTAMRPICIPNDKALRVYPEGLDENADYYVAKLDARRSGRNWMNLGIILQMENSDFSTVTYTFERVG